jgi:hypothetical protein
MMAPDCERKEHMSNEKNARDRVPLWIDHDGGPCPSWLQGSDVIAIETNPDGRTIGLPVTIANWPMVRRFRISHEHWAVPAIENGFEPHRPTPLAAVSNFNSAPEDWDGCDVLLRDCTVETAMAERAANWGDSWSSPNGVIGYRKMRLRVEDSADLDEEEDAWPGDRLSIHLNQPCSIVVSGALMTIETKEFEITIMGDHASIVRKEEKTDEQP